MTRRLRVVLYAEGSGETGLFDPYLPHPGEPLGESHQGPAHRLVARCLTDGEADQRVALAFEAPLRTRGRVARGSDLVDKRVLPRLVTWLDSARAPDLVVILVDGDGDPYRRRRVLEALDSRPSFSPPTVAGLAVLEFESWLIADIAAVNSVLGSTQNQTPAPETLRPGQAKELLTRWIAESPLAQDTPTVRAQLASSLDFDRVGRVCPAFATFLADFRGVISQILDRT